MLNNPFKPNPNIFKRLRGLWDLEYRVRCLENLRSRDAKAIKDLKDRSGYTMRKGGE